MGYCHRMEAEVQLKDGADLGEIRKCLTPILDELYVDEDVDIRNTGSLQSCSIKIEDGILRIDSWGEVCFDFGDLINSAFEELVKHASSPFTVTLYDIDDNNEHEFRFAIGMAPSLR